LLFLLIKDRDSTNWHLSIHTPSL